MADVTFATIRTEMNPCAQQAGGQVSTDGPRSIWALKVFNKFLSLFQKIPAGIQRSRTRSGVMYSPFQCQLNLAAALLS